MAKLADQRVVKELTEKVIAEMEACKSGGKSWKPNWVGSLSGLPYNFITNNQLTGGNMMIALMLGSDSRWTTPSALKKAKIQWKKGSKTVWFLKPIIITKDKETGKDLKKPLVFFKPYPMINGSDIIGLPELDENNTEVAHEDRHNKVQEFIDNLGINFNESGQGRCYYTPSKDSIHMPYKSNFNSLDEYYSVLLHEIAHWTGHKTRLNRDEKIKDLSDNDYAFEELVAELSSMFLSAHFGIGFEPTEQNATYLNSWLKALKGDDAYIWKASKYASEVVNYLIQSQEEVKQAA